MIEQTRNELSKMKLFGVLQSLDVRLEEGLEKGWGHQEFISAIITDEKNYRQIKSTERRVKNAGFRTDASFNKIDFTANRKLSKSQVQELMSLKFIRDSQNLLLLGPTGVGKTFLATAIGNHACLEGYTCLFMGINYLAEKIHLSRVEGSFLRLRDRLIKCDLLILDDLGIKVLSQEIIQDLYDVFEERYQSKSTIITSQLPLENWKEVIQDPVTLEAILDRLIHGLKINIDGDSYRRKKNGTKKN
jgi:DNA replication protein DnaC